MSTNVKFGDITPVTVVSANSFVMLTVGTTTKTQEQISTENFRTYMQEGISGGGGSAFRELVSIENTTGSVAYNPSTHKNKFLDIYGNYGSCTYTIDSEVGITTADEIEILNRDTMYGYITIAAGSGVTIIADGCGGSIAPNRIGKLKRIAEDTWIFMLYANM